MQSAKKMAHLFMLIKSKYLLNFYSKLGVSIISQAILFFLIAFVARKLGAEKFGEFNLVDAISKFVMMLAFFGFPIYADREIPRVQDVSSIVNPILTLKLILGVISLAAMVGIGFSLNKSDDFLWISFIAGIVILIGIIDMSWVFIGKDEMWRVSIRSLIAQIVFAVLVVLFVHSPKNLIVYSICYFISVAVPAMWTFFMYQKHFGNFLTLTLHYNKWKELIKESIPLGLSSITGQINAYAASLITGIYFSTKDLGYYSAGFKLMMLFNAFYKLVKAVVTPTISRLYIQDRIKLLRFMQMYFLLCIVEGLGGAIILYTFSDLIILKLFSSEYLNAIPLLKIWAIGLLPLTPVAMFFAVSLIQLNASKEYFVTSLAGTIITLISMPILIRVAGIKGIAFSHCFMELCMILFGMYFFIRRLNIERGELKRFFNFKESLCYLYFVFVGKRKL